MRPVIRQARLRGLICSVRAGTPPEIEVSGPFALFRRTLLYGRALGEVLPFLTHTARFELVARCHLGGEEGELRLRSGDPIFPAAEPKTFDSKLEERFARDFKRAAPDWDLVREPKPVRAGTSLIFPDFLVRHRLDPGRQHLLEIVGFWTADYIARKLDGLRRAGIDNLILAIDEERRCADGDLPRGARIIWYRKRIDPLKVIDLLRP
jgi:predicted nuclease of restriction endonuclease-like RecB superfamily